MRIPKVFRIHFGWMPVESVILKFTWKNLDDANFRYKYRQPTIHIGKLKWVKSEWTRQVWQIVKQIELFLLQREGFLDNDVLWVRQKGGADESCFQAKKKNAAHKIRIWCVHMMKSIRASNILSKYRLSGDKILCAFWLTFFHFALNAWLAVHNGYIISFTSHRWHKHVFFVAVRVAYTQFNNINEKPRKFSINIRIGCQLIKVKSRTNVSNLKRQR